MPTSCRLLVRCARSDGADGTEEAAWGLVHPQSTGQMVHNSPLLTGYAKVSVDEVLEQFHEFTLPVTPNEDMIKLHDAKGSFIQWPKDDILIDMPKPTNTVSQAPSPTLIPKISEPAIWTSSSEPELNNPMSVVADHVIVVQKPIKPSNETKQAPPPRK